MDAAAQATGSILAGSAVNAGGKDIFNYLKHKFRYVKNMNQNYARLEKEKNYLFAEEKDVKIKLENNKQTMKKTTRCETWLDDVTKIKVEMANLETKYENSCKCFYGFCPFPCRLKLGREIVKMKEEVVSLKNQIREIKVMVEIKPAVPQVPWRLTEEIKELPSLTEHVNMLKECLRDDSLKRICLWGQPGVGKTTILENVHNAVVLEFEITLWVTLNSDGNRNLQSELLKQLHINAEENSSDDQRAGMISEKLKDKSYVLFLDEVSSEISLERVGIHDKHQRGKVVFACTERNTCGLTDEDIHVWRLSDEDAQTLFWKTVGGDFKDNRDIKKTAKLIIQECGGMPNIIKIIGSSLRKKSDPALWRSKLEELRTPSMEPKQQWDEFYRPFKLECDNLKAMKKFLLYWAVFPAGYEVHRDYIIECWRAEMFFENYRKLGKARDRGNAILDEFVDKSLLEKGRKVAHYRMYEHFQRAALRIANCNKSKRRILVDEVEKIEENEWEHAERISLVGNLGLSSLPELSKSSGILTLFLQESSLENIPMSFFGYTTCLQLLDLHKTSIGSIPSSISMLENLKALFLNECENLAQLPPEIGSLGSLEILNIHQTAIHSLPDEIGELTALKCLRVSFKETVANHNSDGHRMMISPNIIKNLPSLEELMVEVNRNITSWGQNVESIVSEVAALENLSTLCFHFPRVDCFKTFIDESKSWNGNNTQSGGNCFRSFNILIGDPCRSGPCSQVDISGCSAEKYLRFSAVDGIFPSAVLKILEQACAFELIDHNAATLSGCGADNLKGLEACIIEDCGEMTTIIDGDRMRGVAFECLKKLHINRLPKLEHIWNGQIRSRSLTMLTTLTVKSCPRVKRLFSKSMVKQLKQLQYLQVEDCDEIEGLTEPVEECVVIEGITEPINHFLSYFPKLKNLQLSDLPKLSSIIDGDGVGGVAFECLKNLHINSLPRLEHLWNGQIRSGSLSMLTTLTVKRCPSVKMLFSKSMVQQLKRLQYLQIEDCEEIEGILEPVEDCVVIEGITESANHLVSYFPELKHLQLSGLPKLSSICPLSTAWPSLEAIMIRACDSLRNFQSIFGEATKLNEIKCPRTWWDSLEWTNEAVKSRLQEFMEPI